MNINLDRHSFNHVNKFKIIKRKKKKNKGCGFILVGDQHDNMVRGWVMCDVGLIIIIIHFKYTHHLCQRRQHHLLNCLSTCHKCQNP